MATIDSKEIIKTMITNNGIYPGDPQCYSIWSYVNDWGKLTYNILYERRSLHGEPHCHRPKLLWSKNSGITPEGSDFLENYDKPEPNLVEVITHCMTCGVSSSIMMTKEQHDRWKGGELVQNVFPDMPAPQRELLISGTHPECWERLFKQGEE